jgi:hypothetical protein
MLETDVARLELWVAAIKDLASIQRSHKRDRPGPLPHKSAIDSGLGLLGLTFE